MCKSLRQVDIFRAFSASNDPLSVVVETQFEVIWWGCFWLRAVMTIPQSFCGTYRSHFVLAPRRSVTVTGPVGDLALRILDRKRQQRTDACSEASKAENVLASMLKANMQTLPLNPRFICLWLLNCFAHQPFWPLWLWVDFWRIFYSSEMYRGNWVSKIRLREYSLSMYP